MGGSTSKLRKCVEPATVAVCEANDNTHASENSRVDHIANMLRVGNVGRKLCAMSELAESYYQCQQSHSWKSVDATCVNFTNLTQLHT